MLFFFFLKLRTVTYSKTFNKLNMLYSTCSFYLNFIIIFPKTELIKADNHTKHFVKTSLMYESRPQYSM